MKKKAAVVASKKYRTKAGPHRYGIAYPKAESQLPTERPAMSRRAWGSPFGFSPGHVRGRRTKPVSMTGNSGIVYAAKSPTTPAAGRTRSRTILRSPEAQKSAAAIGASLAAAKAQFVT